MKKALGKQGERGWTAGALAQAVGATVEGDPDRLFTDVAEVDTASPEHLTVVLDTRRRALLATTRAGVVVTMPAWRLDRSDITWVLHPEPITVLEVLAQWLGLTLTRRGTHETAIVDPEAFVHPTAWVGPFCYIGPRVRLEAEVQVMGFCYLYGDVEVGAQSVLHAGVVVYPRVRMGRRVIVHGERSLGPMGFDSCPIRNVPLKFPSWGGWSLKMT